MKQIVFANIKKGFEKYDRKEYSEGDEEMVSFLRDSCFVIDAIGEARKYVQAK